MNQNDSAARSHHKLGRPNRKISITMFYRDVSVAIQRMDELIYAYEESQLPASSPSPSTDICFSILRDLHMDLLSTVNNHPHPSRNSPFMECQFPRFFPRMFLPAPDYSFTSRPGPWRRPWERRRGRRRPQQGLPFAPRYEWQSFGRRGLQDLRKTNKK